MKFAANSTCTDMIIIMNMQSWVNTAELSLGPFIYDNISMASEISVTSQFAGVINPQHICARGVTVLVRTLCLSICLSVRLSPWNLPLTSFIHWKQEVFGFFVVFSRFCWVAFAENALIKSYGMFTDHRHLPLSLASFWWTKRTTMASFLLKQVCMVSNRSNSTTSSSLIVAH